MVQQGLCKRAKKNEHKNRYCNLFPFDTNLVHLEEKEYVNASWIKLPKDSGDNSSREYLSLPPDKDKNREYIVTMGPLHPSSFAKTLSADAASKMDTCNEFWKLCWMSGCRIVVMLCDISPGFQGCSQYFPITKDASKCEGGDSFIFGNYKITELETILSNDDYIEREFLLERTSKWDSPTQSCCGPFVGGEPQEKDTDIKVESRRVRHLQFKTWPNYGVPDAVKPVAEFIAHVHTRKSELEKEDRTFVPKIYLPDHGFPDLVVHCSGGIGRSGTFLTAFHHFSQYMDILQHKTSPTSSPPSPLSLKETVHLMRLQRHPWMVEGNNQYNLAYDTVLYLLKQIIKDFQDTT